MPDVPTAPECFTVGCDNLAALTDVTRGNLLTYVAHYCSDCYTKLADGGRLDVDISRLEVRLTRDADKYLGILS